MNKKGAIGTILGLIIAVIIIIGIGIWISNSRKGTVPNYPATSNSDSQNTTIGNEQTPVNTNNPTDNNAAGTPSSQNAQVVIKNFSFNPQTLTVKSGTTLVWMNQDSVAHTVTSDSFKSGNISPGSSFQFTFSSPGTYNYSCSIHPSMMGKIIVQ